MKHVLVQWIPTIEAESIFVALELDDRGLEAQTPFVAKDISLEDFERYWDRALTQASSSTGD